MSFRQARSSNGPSARADFLLASLSLSLLLAFLTPPACLAQGGNPLSSSYITPFPQTDRYQVRVIGDWLGSGLAGGLVDAFKQDGSVQITDNSRSGLGVIRQDDVASEIDRHIAEGPFHVAVIFLGANDRQWIRTATARLQPGTPEWKEAYGKEAEKLIKKLKAANIAVYWVGLPIMGNSSYNAIVNAINDTVRQACYLNGVKFIETWTGFTDQLGAYSAYGPDLTGQTKRLREGDGIGFTAAGDRKLANYIEIVLRRDLAQARQQRNIPLAGDEEEQARVVPAAPRGAIPAKGAAAPGAKPGFDAAVLPNPSGQAANPSSGGQQGAAVANASQARQPQAPAPDPAVRQDAAAFSSGYQQGEMILSDIGGGLTAIAVVSPLNDFSARDVQRQTPLADRLYYKVLSKGEALPAKEGRADDFRWRSDPPSKSE